MYVVANQENGGWHLLKDTPRGFKVSGWFAEEDECKSVAHMCNFAEARAREEREAAERKARQTELAKVLSTSEQPAVPDAPIIDVTGDNGAVGDMTGVDLDAPEPRRGRRARNGVDQTVVS